MLNGQQKTGSFLRQLARCAVCHIATLSSKMKADHQLFPINSRVFLEQPAI